MQILCLCQRVPYPPSKGDKLRAFHELKVLGEHHDIDLFTLADEADELEHKAELGSFCRSVTIAHRSPSRARLKSLRYLASATPLTLPYFFVRDLFRQVTEALERRAYDRIFVFCSSMFQYVGSATGVPVIVDLVDVDSFKWQQYAQHTSFPFSVIYSREARLLLEYERTLCKQAACIIVTTDRERDRLQERNCGGRVHVVRNGVDTEYFHVKRPDLPPQSVIVFTGDMSYFPNQHAASFFARDVLPQIRKSIPGVRLLIVGRNPDRAVLRLAELRGVQVTGSVPDVRPFLAQADVSVAPLTIAAGVQNKILEAMSCEVPVIGTSLAVQGLSLKTAAMVETADNAPDLAAACIRLLQDPELARKRGEESRRQVAADYNWQESGRQLLQIVSDTHPPEHVSLAGELLIRSPQKGHAEAVERAFRTQDSDAVDERL